MSPFIFITFTLLITYIVMLSAFIWGWNKQSGKSSATTPQSGSNPTVSIVIACRNEAKNLLQLFESLISQEIQANEIIIVDDNSTDNTYEVLCDLSQKSTNIIVQKSEGNGKKQALRQAINAAKSELILCTDADCMLPTTWVHSVIEAWENESFDLLILPVQMQGNNSVFSQLQIMEFATLVASGGSMANLGRAIMCNGANLAFKKTAYMECVDELHDELPTGDDVFLLHALKKRKARIRFLADKLATVTTKTNATLSEFFSQRARWVSKAPAYTDVDTIAVACVVFGVNMWIFGLFFGMLFCADLITLFLLLFCSKWLLDLIFLMRIRSFFNLNNLLLHSFLLSLLYPIYILFSVFKSLKIK